MATTATVTFDSTLQYEDSLGVKEVIQTAELTMTPATFVPNKFVQNIGTSLEAINLGDCTAPGNCTFVNLDLVNFVEIYTKVSGGEAFAKLKPNGGTAQLYLGSNAQAPAAKADTLPCAVRILLTPA